MGARATTRLAAYLARGRFIWFWATVYGRLPAFPARSPSSFPPLCPALCRPVLKGCMRLEWKGNGFNAGLAHDRAHNRRASSTPAQLVEFPPELNSTPPPHTEGQAPSTTAGTQAPPAPTVSPCHVRPVMPSTHSTRYSLITPFLPYGPLQRPSCSSGYAGVLQSANARQIAS